MSLFVWIPVLLTGGWMTVFYYALKKAHFCFCLTNRNRINKHWTRRFQTALLDFGKNFTLQDLAWGRPSLHLYRVCVCNSKSDRTGRDFDAAEFLDDMLEMGDNPIPGYNYKNPMPIQVFAADRQDEINAFFRHSETYEPNNNVCFPKLKFYIVTAADMLHRICFPNWVLAWYCKKYPTPTQSQVLLFSPTRYLSFDGVHSTLEIYTKW